ncbi:MAG: antibiotic biosynthesis monooxygenase [Planctomycetaceae bacterium]|nr:antibiotic biosynthesis monooxygenase [Planctomycetaceae bacterium]
MAATPTAPGGMAVPGSTPPREVHTGGSVVPPVADSRPAAAFAPANTTCACAGNANLSDQVSFIIKHKVKPGRHDDYEAWLHKTINVAAQQPGHMGAHVAKPVDGDDTYQIAVRFANRAEAEHWMQSPERKQLIDEVMDLIQEPETLDIRSGIDYWFTAATRNHVSPPRWKQWLLTLSAVWPLSMLLPWILDRLYAAVPQLGVFGVRHLIQGMCLVFLLTYVVMPPYTKAVSKWLSRG